jgi:membrane-bound lytic murein transglycosylase B
MDKRKLLIGLTSAGALSVGFGAAVLPASAELRTLTLTLLGGQTIQVTVDVPPGTPLDQIQIPGITTPILSIADSGSATPPPTPTAPAPATPPTDAPVAGPQGEQQTTGKTQRKPAAATPAAADAAHAPAAAKRASKRAVVRTATKERAADGTPTPANPTFSYAIPGAAPVGVPNFFIDRFRIPPFLLPIYQAAGIQYGVRWEILAAINEIESDYGRNLSTSTAGAVGWMQFMPSTWKTYGVDANDDGKKDPYNPVDAIFGAARYLRAAGAETDIKKAIFDYNHADWYVDSVLMRARLIGGLPSDLVGSLTGLTQGHFPVHATARYADDVSEATAARKIAKGKNAALPVDSSATRKGIDIFAKAGSPVIAVQDGKIVKIGHSARLGKFIQLQDVYGNTYTYGQLKKLSTAYPQPKQQTESKAAVARELDLPAKDPAPTDAASGGTQKAVKAVTAKAAKAVSSTADKAVKDVASKAVAPVKERLFANPTRPHVFNSGGQQQILNSDLGTTTFKSYFTEVYGLKRSDVTIKPLKVGSKVIAGTILGRVGKTSNATAPHVRFELRPAGKDAPRIDPKPILDGWKLLESTAIYRAAGKNPFFGPDAKNPSIGQMLLMSKEALQRRVLSDPRVDLYSGGQQDIKGGQVDRRVLATLEFLSASGLKPTVSSLKGNHSLMTTSGNVSEHSSGNAVDIAKINGIPILGHQGPGSITDLTIRRLLTLQGTLKPHQIISLMSFAGADNTLALPDHADHIHVGFHPLYGTNSKLAKQLNSVLKPGQWIKLISRIGSIDNPNVLTEPSKYALNAKPVTRASKAHKSE